MIAKTARNVCAALVCAATGIYVLHWMKNLWGVSGIILALAIAFPTELKGGVAAIKDDAADLKSVKDALK